MILQWFHWAILGVVLVVAELLIPAFVLVWFGLGALFVALLVALSLLASLSPQLLVWIAASSALVVIWFKIFKPRLHKSLAGRSSANVIGEVGILIGDIEPFAKARVRFQTPVIGSEVWECVADTAIEAGSRVKIASIEGNVLRVVKE